MGIMGFHGGEGWMPPLAAWLIGARFQTRDILLCVVSLVWDLSPITQPGGNAGLQPCVSAPPCLHVKKGVGTP